MEDTFGDQHQENFKVMIILDNCFKGTYRGLYATFYCHPSLFSIYRSK